MHFARASAAEGGRIEDADAGIGTNAGVRHAGRQIDGRRAKRVAGVIC